MDLSAGRFTIGVEEEYQLINPHTRELSSDAERVLPRAQEILGEAAQYELILSQVEVATPICSTLDDVRRELAHLRHGFTLAAEDAGRYIAAAGTHPFSRWQQQGITPKARYQELVQTYRQLIREQIIFGCHVHVGVPSPEVAPLLLNHTRIWLAPLLALSANSPFWEGDDTGYSSYRTGLWWTVPLAGPPPYFTSRAHYDETIEMLVQTKSVEDATRLYWDMRLPTRFNTIEFRVMDVCIKLDEAVVLAGLIRALVRQAYQQVLDNEPWQPIPAEILRVANWRAARYGLQGKLLDLRTNQLRPAPDLILELLEFVRPSLEAEGDWQRVSAGMLAMLQSDNGAQRQRNVYAQRRNLHDVVDFLVNETRA